MPVVRISPSVTEGDAGLLRERAPSTMVRSTPNACICAMSARMRPVEAGPASITLPSCSTRAVTKRPSEVVSSDNSQISDNNCRWR